MQEPIPEQIKHGLSGGEEETRPHTAFEYFVRLLVHPGRMLLTPFYHRFETRYTKWEKFEIKFLITDIILLLAALGLIGAALGWLIGQNRVANRIFFEARIAPTEIVSGASSTLIIRYTNGTGLELKDVYLNLSYPEHFQLQELTSGEAPIEGQTISLGDLAPDAVGSVKIRGIIFGDVGGEQIFESKMTFTYSEKNRHGEKIARHIFSPTRSVLRLSLEVPEKIVAGQSFTGYIVYKNTGEFDLPEIKIQPEWPENFQPVSLSPSSWSVPLVKAGEEGRMTFVGAAKIGTVSLFLAFHPSFVFDTKEYKQETLTQEVSAIQPQIKISHSADLATARPGGSLKTLIKYENTGETAVYDVKISVSSDSPFVSEDTTTTIGIIKGHTSGETEIELKLRPSITQSETSTYEHLNIDTKAAASYKIEDDTAAQLVTVYDSTILTPLITPIVFRCFGRYATENGDQLGRGPLPPELGETTKYWIFWTINGTTNELKNLALSGLLPDNVEFTGRQTVSEGEAVAYDAATKTVSWSASEIYSTFSPTAKIIGAAFEVAITPLENQIGTTPTLISEVLLSGTDGWTGAWVTASGTSVTTNLPGDLMADGLGVVVD